MIKALIQHILKPPFAAISNSDIGPPVFSINNKTLAIRKDITINQMQANYYTLVNQQESKGTVIYCHSYNSNRSQGLSILPFLIQQKLNLLTFDFQKTRNGGNYDNLNGVISFGYYEAQQILHVVNWLKKYNINVKNRNQNIYLWGRSMGASAVLQFYLKYKQVQALVLDSPYTSFKDLCINYANQKLKMPCFISQSLFQFTKPELQQLLGFEIQKLNLYGQVLINQINIPAVYVCSKKDKLASESTQKFFNVNKNKKNSIIYTSKLHNQDRQREVYLNIINDIFKMVKFQINKLSRIHFSKNSVLNYEYNFERSLTNSYLSNKQNQKQQCWLKILSIQNSKELRIQHTTLNQMFQNHKNRTILALQNQ